MEGRCSSSAGVEGEGCGLDFETQGVGCGGLVGLGQREGPRIRMKSDEGAKWGVEE